jgi:NAD(P)-dependent dehydrogenase (short-subunit alcohol dehydrogenase family)
MPADLTNADDVRRMADEALSPRGTIDILVNNAGVSILGGVAELTEAAWQREIDTNRTSVCRVSKSL